MRSLFQNKGFVFTMVVCAILSVGWRVKTYWRPSFLQGFARPSSEIAISVDDIAHGDEANPQESMVSPDADKANGDTRAVGKLPWADWRIRFLEAKVARDPFAPASHLETTPSQVVEVPLPDVSSLVLQAVTFQPDQALAVINQKTYGIGESVGQFVIEEIRAREVTLKHPNGRRVLRLQFGTSATTTTVAP